ncbi:MAG: hypothetical protein QOK84_02840 [Nitrososphaeraceae archaeon]|nr:hypothetical protein [Nitrososphaeraceae archaeon]MDW3653896.1 hypothetical protein [Nitrososphaeraceae archaeon]
MSNTEASEENVKSPSTYGNDGYQEYRKKEKKKKKEIPPFTTEHHMKNVNENAGLDGNDNYIHRRMQDQQYRKKEKKKNKTDPEKEDLNTVISYSKYAVGGESKEVPASAGLDEKDNFIHRRELNQPKQKKSRKKK